MIGIGNLNRRRAIGGVRAAVRDDGGCLSRAARKRFTADGHKRTTIVPPNAQLVQIRIFASMSPIGPKLTYRDVCYLVAFAGKADISERLPNKRKL